MFFRFWVDSGSQVETKNGQQWAQQMIKKEDGTKKRGQKKGPRCQSKICVMGFQVVFGPWG